jgi:hypothetical protein
MHICSLQNKRYSLTVPHAHLLLTKQKIHSYSSSCTSAPYKTKDTVLQPTLNKNNYLKICFSEPNKNVVGCRIYFGGYDKAAVYSTCNVQFCTILHHSVATK